MKKLLLFSLILVLLPQYSSHANNVNPVITGLPIDGNIKISSPNQHRIYLKVLADRTDDPNRDRPSLKVSIDNLDEAITKGIVDCYSRTSGGNYYETAGAGKVVYDYACDFSWADKIQFDSNRIKFRITATHLSKVSFVDSEIELGGVVISPIYKVDKIQFTADGQFRFQATTRLTNLKVPASDVKFQICIDDFGCESASASSSGLVDYSRAITAPNTWLRVRISATANNGSFGLSPLTETIVREKSPTPSPTATPSSAGSNPESTNSDSKSKKEPKTKLRASIAVPVSAKLGKPFPVKVSIKGSGLASCYFAVYFSTNGWASYNTNGGTASKRFQVKGGSSVTTNGVMAVNYKGPWGVILYCFDVKTTASLPIVVGRMIQN
jgi:hypothetical protein